MTLESTEKIALHQLFWSFTKIGAFTIGGGYAMLPLIEHEVVTHRQWIENQEFCDMVVVAQSMPGILAMNISILVGTKLRGKCGAVVGALGSSWTSFVVILLLAMCFGNYADNPLLNKIFRAVRPAAVALIAVPIFNMAKNAHLTWRTAWIPVVVAFGIWYWRISPVLFIVIFGIGGLVYFSVAQGKIKQFFAKKAVAKSVEKSRENHSATSAPKMHLTRRQRKIVTYLRKNPTASYVELQHKMSCSYSTIYREICVLKERGVLEFIGANKNGTWKVNL